MKKDPVIRCCSTCAYYWHSPDCRRCRICNRLPIWYLLWRKRKYERK